MIDFLQNKMHTFAKFEGKFLNIYEAVFFMIS